jgi:hypothetical protein
MTGFSRSSGRGAFYPAEAIANKEIAVVGLSWLGGP